MLQKSSLIDQCHLNPVNDRNDLRYNQKKTRKPKFEHKSILHNDTNPRTICKYRFKIEHYIIVSD